MQAVDTEVQADSASKAKWANSHAEENFSRASVYEQTVVAVAAVVVEVG